MRVLAILNIKGGVGKTAAAVNLAFLAARGGWRTLIWDLDPQGAASFYLRVKPKVPGGGKKLARGKLDLDGLIKGSDYQGLDLLPADFSYRKMDIALDGTRKPRRQIGRLIDPLSVGNDRLIGLQVPKDTFDAGQHRGQRSVHLVGKPGGQHTQGCQAMGFGQSRFSSPTL